MFRFKLLAFCALAVTAAGADKPAVKLPEAFTKPRPLTMAELAQATTDGVAVAEVSDYVYPGYQGDFKSPPHGDVNAKRAFIIYWKDRPYRFVFSHDGSYCPWFEFPSGAGASFQWWEGNDGWAEPLCDFGRWINSRGHEVDAESLKLYPNHFSPAGMDFFALANDESARLVCYSLIGVGGEDLERVRALARQWLEKGDAAVAQPDSGADLPALLQ